MAQSLQLKIKGLYTSLNELSEVPEGALLVADNIDISKDSIAEPRRGFERVTGAYSTATHRAKRSWFYQGKQFSHHGDPGSENTVSFLDAGVWTSVGTFSAPTGFRVRDLTANQNLFFTTSAGVKKLDAYNGTARQAGAVKALDLQASLGSNGTALANNARVAYRMLWGYRDANDNLILGAPSQREEISNSSGNDKDVSITFTIPSGVTTSWIYQIYRSAEFGTSETPNDELGLVYEASPSSGDITAGLVTLTDITPTALRGPTIYTAGSQESIGAGNEAPPLAKDMAVFRDCVFYLNTVSKHRYTLTLIAVGGSSGIANDDTVTIGGVTYTGKGSETIASAQFKVETAGTPSQYIRDTALSLVRVINRHASSTVYAYYLSGPDQLPGIILLEERSIGGNAFAVVSSKATCWNPSLPSSGTAESSTNDSSPNGLAWSKPNQPESVPLPNKKGVGSKDAAGLRLVPLKDALYVFKADGIYKVTGYYPYFEIELLDSSAKLVGADTPAILNNQIFCLTDQGVTIVSDGVKIISRPIEQDLLRLFDADLSLVESTSWGVGYETERKYYLFMVDSAGDTHPTQAWVFNVFTNAWTRHLLSATTGVVYEKRLYLGDASSQYFLRDRRSSTYLDYADFGFSTSITAAASLVVTLADGTDNISVGDVLYQSATVFSLITAVDPLVSQVTVQTNPGFTVAAVDVLKAIATEIKWAPITLGNPAITKHFHTAIPLFKADFSGTGYLTFSSDLSPYDESVPLEGRGIASWGLFPWGERPWGGASSRRPIPQWIPREKQRCSQLIVSFEHAYGFSPWELQGLSVFGEPGSEKISR
jgi:hypothetical protein